MVVGKVFGREDSRPALELRLAIEAPRRGLVRGVGSVNLADLFAGRTDERSGVEPPVVHQ